MNVSDPEDLLRRPRQDTDGPGILMARVCRCVCVCVCVCVLVVNIKALAQEMKSLLISSQRFISEYIQAMFSHIIPLFLNFSLFY